MRIRTICIEKQKEFQMLDDGLSYPSSFDTIDFIQRQRIQSSSKAIAYHSAYYAIKKTKMHRDWFEQAENSLIQIQNNIPQSVCSANEYESAINNCILELRCAMLFR